MEGSEYEGKKSKLGQRGHFGGHVTHFWNFGTVKAGKSNFTHTWMAMITNEKNAKLGQKGCVSLNYTLNATFTCAMTNIVHKKR